MWGGPPPSGYYPPQSTGAPPYYAPSYPTAATPYGSAAPYPPYSAGYPYGAAPPSSAGGGLDMSSSVAFPSPGAQYDAQSLGASFGALSLSSGYGGPPPSQGPSVTVSYPHASAYASSSCGGGRPPSSCGSGGGVATSSCSSMPAYAAPPSSPCGGPSSSYYSAAPPPAYYTTPHAMPAYTSSSLPPMAPQASTPAPPPAAYPQAYASGPAPYSAPPSSSGGGSPSPYGPQAAGASPQASPYSSGPAPYIPHMSPVSAPYYGGQGSPQPGQHVAQPPPPQQQPLRMPQPQPHHSIPAMPPSSPSPSLSLAAAPPGGGAQAAYCSTADCYGPSSGSFPVRQTSPSPPTPAPLVTSVSYPQLPHAAPASSSSAAFEPSAPSPLSSSGSVATTSGSGGAALLPSLRRYNTTSMLEASRQREREKEQEAQQALERERRAIVGNITALPHTFQTAVDQMSIKDLKALQEQFGSLTLTTADTKIAINDFASNTGFRPDSTLVRFLFQLFDVDKNGFITEVDFLSSMSFFMKGARKDKLEWVFDTLDSNNDGVIDEMELNDVILSMYQTLSSLGITVSMTALMPFLSELFAAVPVNGKLHQTMTKEQFVQLEETRPRLLQGLGLLNCEGPEKRVGKRGTPVSLIGASWKTCFYLMLGLRISIQMANGDPTGEPSTADFKAVTTFELAKTDMTKAETWTFTDYAPLVFKRFRAMCGIDESEYLLALGPEQVLGNLLRGDLSTPSVQLSDGKSGSFFYYSHDGRFLVKTIPLDECTSLFQILQGYYEHFQRYPGSLIGRFFGLHKINQTAFVVMENVFQTNIPIHRVYDLKGSTVNRSTAQGESVQKDMDLNHLFLFDAETRNQLVSQVHKDSDFLRERNLMDYSLLVGIHFLNYPDIECRPVDPGLKPKVSGSDALAPVEENAPFFRRDYGGIQGRKKNGTPLGEIYFIGIIDILTTYSYGKSAENFVKSLFVNKHAISAVPPDEYSARFKNYVSTIFE